jgi:transglutaminase-like putative cysteine protease
MVPPVTCAVPRPPTPGVRFTFLSKGWFGLDPTNNVLADERYIKIATGRDYDDAAPIRGSFSGPNGATAALEVTVEVELA